MSVIINFFGGPGSGKSLMSWYTSYRLGVGGVNVEYCSEFAKDKVWDEHYNTLDDQLLVFANQRAKVNRLLNKVNYIVSDSPTILALFYGKKIKGFDEFEQIVLNDFHKNNNINFLIKRDDRFHKNLGRVHSLEESKRMDKTIEKFLIKYNIKYHEISQFGFEKEDSELNIIIDNILRAAWGIFT